MAKQSLKFDTPDTLTTTNRDESGGFFLENVRLLGIIGIVLLAVLGGIYYYFYTQQESNSRALVELSRIRSYYDQSDYEKAMNGDTSKTMGGEPVHGLTFIVDEWGSTPAGRIAALYLGNSYLATGQAEKAAEPFEIATGSGSPLVRSAAYAGIAAVAEATQKYEDAATAYLKAASEDPVDLNTPAYLVGAARNYEQASKIEEAIEQYRRVAVQYPNSSVIVQARLALARHDVEL